MSFYTAVASKTLQVFSIPKAALCYCGREVICSARLVFLRTSIEIGKVHLIISLSYTRTQIECLLSLFEEVSFEQAHTKPPEKRADSEVQVICRRISPTVLGSQDAQGMSWTDQTIELVSKRVVVCRYQSQDIVYTAGAAADSFFWVLEGCVGLFRNRKLVSDRTIETGGTFGEMDILRGEGSRRQKNAIVQRTATLLRIESADYDAVFGTFHRDRLQDKVRFFEQWHLLKRQLDRSPKGDSESPRTGESPRLSFTGGSPRLSIAAESPRLSFANSPHGSSFAPAMVDIVNDNKIGEVRMSIMLDDFLKVSLAYYVLTCLSFIVQRNSVSVFCRDFH